MRFILLLTILSLLTVGCHGNRRCQRENAMVRASFVDLEDKYFLLKSEHEATLNELRGYKGEPIESSYFMEHYPDGHTIIKEGTPSNETAPDDSIFELNTPTPAPSSDAQSQPDRPSTNLPATEISHRRQVYAEITEITINQRSTSGHDVDGILGDEGINLLVQPRTADGSVSLQAGELTVSIIDPAETAQHQRVGLWKFLPSETELFFSNDELESRGILLHLPWDQSTPIRSRLMLHVRFVTADGRTLKASSEIRITPPADNYSPDAPLVAQWTLHDDRWDKPAQPKWHRQRGDRRQVSSGSAVPTDGSSPTRVKIKATPVKSTNNQPRWRPIR